MGVGVVLAQAEGQMMAQGNGLWPSRDPKLPGAVSWAERAPATPCPQPSPQLSALGALFSDWKGDRVGQESTGCEQV